MQIGNRSIYTWSSLLLTIDQRFTDGKDEWLRGAFLTDEMVFNPEIKPEGLRARQLMIMVTPLIFMLASIPVFFLAALLAIILGGTPFPIGLIFGLGFCLLFISMSLSLTRGFVASTDEIRLRIWIKRNRDISNFRVSRHAYIQWYDLVLPLVWGIPLIYALA